MNKVSVGMVEAGLSALAHSRKAHQSDEATCAAVWSAMDRVRLAEETRRGANTPAPVYVHQSWPAWRYGPAGEAKVFQRPEDVPEGWINRPQTLVQTVAAEIPPRKPKRAA